MSTNVEVCEKTSDHAKVVENEKIIHPLPHFEETDLPKETMKPLYATSGDGKPIGKY